MAFSTRLLPDWKGRWRTGATFSQADHGVKQPLPRVLGVAGHEADEEVPGDGVHLLQQPGKVHPPVQVLAVGVHVLAQEGDVLVPRRGQLPDLGQDVLRLAAALPPRT